MSDGGENILEIEDLCTYIYDPKNRGFFRIVDGVTLTVPRGQTTAVVGESGSGKSSVAYSLLGLVPDVPGVISGRIGLDTGQKQYELLAGLAGACKVKEQGGEVTVSKDAHKWRKKLGYDATMRQVRGRHIAIMMQEAKSALNPYISVAKQVKEAFLIGGGVETDADETVGFLLKELHIYDKANEYPHNLSGGTCHRAMMAVAFAANPDLLIADEPTTGLDSPIQIKVVDLLQRFKNGELMPNATGQPRSMLLVSHQIELVETLADQMVVMYGGRIMESGSSEAVLTDPQHPYTRKIVKIYQEPPAIERDVLQRLDTIRGFVPSALTRSPGCRFADRCDEHLGKGSACDRVKPRLLDIGASAGHKVSCHLYNSEIVQQAQGAGDVARRV